MIQFVQARSHSARPATSPEKHDKLLRSSHAARAAALPGRIVIHPEEGPAEGIDVTQRVVSVVASELWQLRGGNDVLNWIEAERLLIHALLAGTQDEANPRAAASNRI